MLLHWLRAVMLSGELEGGYVSAPTVILIMGNVCPYEIVAYDIDLAHFSFMRSVIPGSFLTPQSPFLITVLFPWLI